MSALKEKNMPTLGFLTVVPHTQNGLFGGLLVLNLAGRPLEFHLTAPVKANRAQEILYGPTLKPYLYGEQIGGALLAKLKTPALAICTDCPEALAVRPKAGVPVVWVPAPSDDAPLPEDDSPAASTTETETIVYRQDPPHDRSATIHGPSWLRFQLGGQAASVERKFSEDQAAVEQLWREAGIEIDLHEPFARIREAIDEAQTTAR